MKQVSGHCSPSARATEVSKSARRSSIPFMQEGLVNTMQRRLWEGTITDPYATVLARKMGWAKLATFAVTFLSGGLAGAVFTWYVNLPATTVLAYSISTTTITADPAVRSTVPGLRLQIGNEAVPALYTHAVEFSIPSGPHIDRIELALIAEGPLRTYGISSFAPSPLHEMACGKLGADSIRCIMGPIGSNSRGPFRVIWATNRASTPKIVTATKGVDLLALVEYAARAERWWQIGRWIVSVGLSFLGVVLAAILASLQRIQRRARIAKAQADVRAIASAVSIYAAHMVATPTALREITSPSRNSRGQTSGPFLSTVPTPPPGWTPYTYTPGEDGSFTVESSGDGTTVRVP